MKRAGTKVIRTQIHPSQPKREITNLTNSQNTKRTYGQPSVMVNDCKHPHEDLKLWLTVLKIIAMSNSSLFHHSVQVDTNVSVMML